ncbi:MAG: hypothetical protein G01um101420_227 [Parcubacteria group bacterium Gr01-1014_20]|nr:MAG: hypothetical protein G01um101420_227 [Parcubacteria group bacterium Gr01-1014_20]
MIGIVLGLGFQWWPDLKESWQYIAFIFVYLSIIDYWVDTSAANKKYPPKKELDLIIDVAIMFTLFLLIYSSLQTISYLLITFIVFRIFDSFWIVRRLREHGTELSNRRIFHTWLKSNIIDVITALILIVLSYNNFIPPLTALIAFILFRITLRIVASVYYKKVYFA